MYRPPITAPNAVQFIAYDGFGELLTEAELNALVLQTEPSIATRELVDGMYALAGPADLDFIPAGWRETAETEHVYREVVAPACRTCHVSRDDALSLGSSAEFLRYGAMIEDSLCGRAHDMPNAEAVLVRMWTSRSRAYVAGFLGSSGSCAPTPGP